MRDLCDSEIAYWFDYVSCLRNAAAETHVKGQGWKISQSSNDNCVRPLPLSQFWPEHGLGHPENNVHFIIKKTCIQDQRIQK